MTEGDFITIEDEGENLRFQGKITVEADPSIKSGHVVGIGDTEGRVKKLDGPIFIQDPKTKKVSVNPKVIGIARDVSGDSVLIELWPYTNP